MGNRWHGDVAHVSEQLNQDIGFGRPVPKVCRQGPRGQSGRFNAQDGSLLGGSCLGVDAFTLRAEQAEHLGCLGPVAAEPVRHPGVEFGHLSRAKDEIMVAQDEPHTS